MRARIDVTSGGKVSKAHLDSITGNGAIIKNTAKIFEACWSTYVPYQNIRSGEIGD